MGQEIAILIEQIGTIVFGHAFSQFIERWPDIHVDDHHAEQFSLRRVDGYRCPNRAPVGHLDLAMLPIEIDLG